MAQPAERGAGAKDALRRPGEGGREGRNGEEARAAR